MTVGVHRYLVKWCGERQIRDGRVRFEALTFRCHFCELQLEASIFLTDPLNSTGSNSQGQAPGSNRA